jgi:hypothetical protein
MASGAARCAGRLLGCATSWARCRQRRSALSAKLTVWDVKSCLAQVGVALVVEGCFGPMLAGVAGAPGLQAHADVCDLCPAAGSADLVRAPDGWREAGHQACLGVTRWPAIAAGGVSSGLRTGVPTTPAQPLC